jgi:hypothetical protein
VDEQVLIALAVALISGATAVVSILIGARTSKTASRLQYQLDLEKNRATKQELSDELMSRYREPLLRAAFDLQSRLYNIVKQDFLRRYAEDPVEGARDYAVKNTLYVLAEYLAWVEILRRDVQFLDLGDVERSQQLTALLEQVVDALATDERLPDPTLRLFRGEQRAIGELMVELERDYEGNLRHQCIGYAHFVARLHDEPDFAQWFHRLDGDVEAMMLKKTASDDRLTELQHVLVDLIAFLDDPPSRFLDQRCTKL